MLLSFLQWLLHWCHICFRRAVMPYLMQRSLSRWQIRPPHWGCNHALNTNIPVCKVIDAWELKDGGAAILVVWIMGVDILRLVNNVKRCELRVSCGYTSMNSDAYHSPQKCKWPTRCALCWDVRLSHFRGSFPSEREFNRFHLSLLDCYWWQEMPEEYMRYHRWTDKIVFTRDILRWPIYHHNGLLYRHQFIVHWYEMSSKWARRDKKTKH